MVSDAGPRKMYLLYVRLGLMIMYLDANFHHFCRRTENLSKN